MKMAAAAVDGDTQELNDPLQSLLAAANFLSGKVSDERLGERVKASAVAKNSLGATTQLADAFILVLDRPLDDEEIGSVEGCMQELLLWVQRECAMNDALVDKISNDLCGGTSRGALRLKCMSLLYNAVSEEEPMKRFGLLKKTIKLATSVKLVPKIEETVLPSIDGFLKLWKVSPKDKRAMYLMCYEALKSVEHLGKAFDFNVKMLELYNGSDVAECAQVDDAAIDAIVQAVRLPKLYRFDKLLELDVIKAFANADGDKKLLYQLIKIFVQDDLNAFMVFYNAHSDFIGKYGIGKDVAVDKMRLLTFASLGIDSQDLSYDVISSALQIPEDLVEEWVIRAIGSGLVDAKINQLKNSVAIYRSTQRMFTRGEWQPLSERINIWKGNVSDLLVSLREMKRVQAQVNSQVYA